MQTNSILDLLQDLRRKCLESDLAILDGLHITQAEYHFFVASLSIPNIETAAIGKKMDISPSRLSRIIESMVQHGFLQRTLNSDDRRAIRLSFTPKGEEILKSIVNHRQQCELKLHNNLPDEIKQRLADDLRFLIDNV
jgi:MarR family transcriptional regulator, organic hydroperoxide resistance regulator